MDIITLDGVSFGYEGKIILSDITLRIAEGDFIGLIGENGSGKSTLIKGLVGLIKPLRGKIVHAPSVSNHIGYVPQRGQLDPIYPLTVLDIIRMGFKESFSWMPSSRHKADVESEELLEKVGMEHRSNDAYASLSGGQQQRVLIARALATRSRMLILDEPTAGIDMRAEEEIMGLLETLNRDENISILLVSHKIPALQRFIKTVFVLKDQHIRIGPVADILAPDKLVEIIREMM